MSTDTRLATTHAAPPTNWRTRAACSGTDLESFFEDTAEAQRTVQAVCQRCPVRPVCLSDVMGWESEGYMLWGVVGGLTSVQRRALRCEAFLGNEPNLKQAALLASWRWSSVMEPMLDWPADMVTEALRRHGVIAASVTVRVALWWIGGRATVLRLKQDDDRRQLWHRVRDECRDVVYRLRGLGLGNRDVAAYLGVSEDALQRAVQVWRNTETQAEEAIAV